MSNRYGPKDFQFLEEIAELVIRARRALTYTYPMRFFLEPGPKQRFFDFIQGDLESSLEKLNKRNEEDWYSYVDVNAFKEIHLGERFFKYKEEINTLRSTLGEHFSRVIN